MEKFISEMSIKNAWTRTDTLKMLEFTKFYADFGLVFYTLEFCTCQHHIYDGICLRVLIFFSHFAKASKADLVFFRNIPTHI